VIPFVTFRHVIASIDFKDFKILRQARIELSPFNLIIGPNGSGKTSVIESIRRLRNLASLPIVPGAVPTPPRSSRLEFHFNPPHAGLAVVLSCTPDLACDGLSLSGSSGAQHSWHSLADKLESVRFHSLDPLAMARPCRADAPTALAEDGANIAAALHELKGKAPADFAAIASEFTRILPEFSKVKRSGPAGPLKSNSNCATRVMRSARLIFRRARWRFLGSSSLRGPRRGRRSSASRRSIEACTHACSARRATRSTG
jgi:energy-coupling factor transporter ATP-binding protein EcfA2